MNPDELNTMRYSQDSKQDMNYDSFYLPLRISFVIYTLKGKLIQKCLVVYFEETKCTGI